MSTLHPFVEHSMEKINKMAANSLINTPMSNCVSKMFSLAIIVTPNSEKMLIAYNQLSSRQSIKAPHHTLLFTLLLIGCFFPYTLSLSFSRSQPLVHSLCLPRFRYRSPSGPALIEQHSAMVATLDKNKRANYERMMDSNGIFYKPIDYVWNDAQLR